MSQPTQTIRLFVEDAYQLISASTPTVPLHGNDLSKGVQYLNMLLEQYGANGLMITVAKQVDFSIITGQGTVIFAEPDFEPPPTPDVTTEGRLVNLENAWVTLDNVNYPLIDISRNEFFSSYKYGPLQGLPRYVIVKPDINYTKVQFFPAPSQGYDVSIYAKFQVSKLTANSDMSLLPTYYQLYLQYALARYLAFYKGRADAWTDKLEKIYRELEVDMQATSSINLDININNESWLNGAWRVRAGI